MTDSEFFLLSTKLLPILVYPLSFVIILSIMGLFVMALARRRFAIALLGAAVSWLWLASMPIFADWAIATLERQFPAQPIETMPKADVAIILGGAVSQPVPPRVDVDLNGSFDRVYYAMQLYRAGRIKKVLVTGGNLPWLPNAIPEAELIRSFLVDWGNIPPDIIEIATQSRNTRENALEIKKLWEDQPFKSALLITSAAHMPRAIAVFQKVGLPVTAATTDIEALNDVPLTPLRWLPDASALALTTVAIREWLGYWAYRLRGHV